MKCFRNCELYSISENCWNDFVVEKHMDLSDFEAWAIRKAADVIGMVSEKGHNCYYWSDGQFCQEYYKGDNKEGIYSLGITNNGILIMEVQDADYKRVAMYRVKMD